MKKPIAVFIILIFSQVLLYSQENRHYGADYIYEKEGVAVFWAVLKGPEFKLNTVYINLVHLDTDKTDLRKYSVIESNVFSGEENILVKNKKIKNENILKKSYGDFLTMSETEFSFFQIRGFEKKSLYEYLL